MTWIVPRNREALSIANDHCGGAAGTSVSVRPASTTPGLLGTTWKLWPLTIGGTGKSVGSLEVTEYGVRPPKW